MWKKNIKKNISEYNILTINFLFIWPQKSSMDRAVFYRGPTVMDYILYNSNCCPAHISGSLCDSWSSQAYLLPVLDTVLVRASWRRRGCGLHMLEDFCNSLSTEEFMGVSSPLSPGMVAGQRRFSLILPTKSVYLFVYIHSFPSLFPFILIWRIILSDDLPYWAEECTFLKGSLVVGIA